MRLFTLQILRITFLFLVASANDSFAQEFSVNFKNIPLKKAIKILERKANIHFTYSDKQIKVHQKVSLTAKQEPLESILKQLFLPVDINYKIYKNADILLVFHPSKEHSSDSTPDILEIINGQIQDKNRDPLIGSSVFIRDTNMGVITDDSGNFSLTIKELPITLRISYTGYENQEIKIDRFNVSSIQIIMLESNIILDEVIVDAPRYTEQILETPVTIEKIDGITIQASSAESVIDAFANIKGVQAMKGSLSGAVLNTRGFSNMNNLRFLMHLDDMDVTTPSFGVHPNLGGVSILDIQSAEIIPGSASALYGANAFNGILRVKTKDPYLHQGVAVHLKTGLTYQQAGGVNPYNNFSFRIAKALNEKLAFKIDYEGLVAKDWIADDYTQRHISGDPLTPPNQMPPLTSPDQASYDATNIAGDADGGFNTEVFPTTTSEVTTSGGITHDWTLGKLSRTGYREEDILDNSITNNRVNLGLYYKINKDFRLEGVFKYGTQDLMFRNYTTIPFSNFTAHQQKLALKGKGWTAKIYTNFQNPKKTSPSILTATFVQTELLSNADWGQHFVDAYYGEVSTVQPSSIQMARAYADAEMAPIGSDAYKEALRTALESMNTDKSNRIPNPILNDKSWFWQTDVLYDFNELIKDPSWTLIIGGSYRRYTLRSNGNLYNDNKRAQFEQLGFAGIGYEGNIKITESSIYGQVAKKMLNDRLHLSYSVRMNGHSSYQLNYVPQVSVMFSPDIDKKHHIRATLSTGLKNPGLYEQYSNISGSSYYTRLGGIDDNLNNYVDPFNYLTGKEIREIFKNQLGYEHKSLQPEKNTTFEIGYKGLLANGKLLVDFNAYHTTYKNLIELVLLPIIVPTTNNFKLYNIFINMENQITSKGLGFGLEYFLKDTYRIYGNYEYADFTFIPTSGKLAELGQVVTAFNTPKNRLNVGLNKSNKKGGIGFDIAARYASEWIYSSPFGKGYIPELFTIDASISYRWTNFNFTLGASNLNRKEYRSVIGGPKIGSLYTLSVLYNMEL